MKLIELGIVKVEFGVRGDPERLKKIAGDFPFYNPHDLLDRLPGLPWWPEGQITEKLFVLDIKSKTCNSDWWRSSLSDLNKWLMSEGYVPKGFPHLAAITGKVNELSRQGVQSVAATDPNSNLYPMKSGFHSKNDHTHVWILRCRDDCPQFLGTRWSDGIELGSGQWHVYENPDYWWGYKEHILVGLKP